MGIWEIFRKSAESPLGKSAKSDDAPAHDFLAYLRDEVSSRIRSGELTINHAVDALLDASVAAVVAEICSRAKYDPSPKDIAQFTMVVCLSLSSVVTELGIQLQCFMHLRRMLQRRDGDDERREE